jgi:hypothetical protein
MWSLYQHVPSESRYCLYACASPVLHAIQNHTQVRACRRIDEDLHGDLEMQTEVPAGRSGDSGGTVLYPPRGAALAASTSPSPTLSPVLKAWEK